MGHGAETTFNMYFKSLFDAWDEECDNENEYDLVTKIMKPLMNPYHH